MESVIQDVRHGIRSLVSSPGFVLLSVICLGVGIGANTTMFTVVNGLLLRPLPFPESHRLVTLNEIRHEHPDDPRRVSYPNFRLWQEHAGGVAELAAVRARHLTISDASSTERYPAALVSWNLLRLLDIRPILGRGLQESDDRAGAEPVVLLSESLWRERYAAEPSMVGRSIVIGGSPHTVVGIVPRFTHPAIPGALRGARLWMPLSAVEHDSPHDRRTLAVYAKAPAAVRMDRLTTQLATVAKVLEEERAENMGWGIVVRPLATSFSATTRAMLTLMMGAVAFVLLIACANVGNLMLARAMNRRREVAVRLAIGATRGRIVRQLVTESLLVGLMSASAGLLVASWGVGLLIRASDQAGSVSLPIDARVLLFTAAIAVLTSLLFGVAPALHVVRDATGVALADGGRDSTASRSQKYLRNALVAGEVSLAVILAIVASLFVRSFINLLESDKGFDTSRLATLSFEIPEGRYSSGDAIARRVDEIVARLQALPGVEAVAASNLAPLRGGGARTTATAERMRARGGAGTNIVYGGVTSGYFATLNVSLLRGRDFSDAEARTDAPVAIVNRRMAERLWPGEDPLGQRFELAALPEAGKFTVVGVVVDTSNWDLSHRPLPTAYLPYPHVPVRDPRLVIRASGDPLDAAAPARQAIQAADPALAVFAVQSLDGVHRSAFWRQELVGLLLTIFGAVAMLLAILGVYGVLAYLVSQRTREIGVRMALGADRGDVVRLIVRQGMALVLGGVGCGLAGAFGAARVIRGQLYEVSAADPLSFGGAALLLAGVGLAASYVPARRAARLDPIASLRD